MHIMCLDEVHPPPSLSAPLTLTSTFPSQLVFKAHRAHLEMLVHRWRVVSWGVGSLPRATPLINRLSFPSDSSYQKLLCLGWAS